MARSNKEEFGDAKDVVCKSVGLFMALVALRDPTMLRSYNKFLERIIMRRVVFIVLFACYACSIPGDAQELMETVNFIREKANFSDTEAYTPTRYQIEIDDCHATYWFYFLNPHPKQAFKEKQVVSIEDLDPTRVEQLGKSVVLYATKDKPKIKKNLYFRHGIKKADSRSRLVIVGKNQREGGQLARAFEHLISICGGKAELF